MLVEEAALVNLQPSPVTLTKICKPNRNPKPKPNPTQASLVNNYEKTDLFVLTFTKRQDS